MNWQDHIITDKNILLGKPIIKGTRISVQLILELFSNGWTHSMILESYPNINEKDLQAVFLYVSDCMKDEFLFSSSKTA
jgi:uncharacterized protein (DUF433 family)